MFDDLRNLKSTLSVIEEKLSDNPGRGEVKTAKQLIQDCGEELAELLERNNQRLP